MNKSRQTKLDKNYAPLPSRQDDEIYRNGIFNFNISRILEYIEVGKLDAEREQIRVKDWFKTHIRGSVKDCQ